jgi:hypothetical protein
LRSLEIDLNGLFLLECFYYQEDREFFDIFTIPSLQDFNLSAQYQFLKKNEYLVEDPNDTSKMILSVKGKVLIEDLINPLVKVSENVSARGIMLDLGPTEEDQFNEWWKTYPSSTAWESEDGVKFVGSRSLKNLTKAEAKKRYLKLLNQGLLHEDLVGSLKYEIKLKKLDSVKKNANQMDFFKGMESYLNQERYLTYVDNFRQNPDFVKGTDKVKGKKQNVRDI